MTMRVHLCVFCYDVFSPGYRFFFRHDGGALRTEVIVQTSQFTRKTFSTIFYRRAFVYSTAMLASTVTVRGRSLIPSTGDRNVNRYPLTGLTISVFTRFVTSRLFVLRVRSDDGVGPPRINKGVNGVSYPRFVGSVKRGITFSLIFTVRAVAFYLSMQLPFLPHLEVGTILSRGSSGLPFTSRGALYLGNFLSFSATMGFAILGGSSSSHFGGPCFTILTLFSIALRTSPLVMLTLASLWHFTRLSREVRYPVYMSYFTFRSHNYVGVYERFFDVSAFSFSSTDSQSFHFVSFSDSLDLATVSSTI